MRQFFMVLGAVFVIIAGVSPVKRQPAPEYRIVEVGRSGVLPVAASARFNPGVRLGVMQDAGTGQP